MLDKEWIDLILYAFEIGLESKDIKEVLNNTINSRKAIEKKSQFK